MTSRAVPVPGPTADPGTQAATADQAAMADPGIPAATADQAAMADPGILAAMADQAATEGPGTEEAMAERVLGRPWRSGVLGWPWRVAPPQNFHGEAPHPRGALRSRGRRAGQGQRREK